MNNHYEWNGVEGSEESNISLLVAVPEEGHEYFQILLSWLVFKHMRFYIMVMLIYIYFDNYKHI